MVGGGSVLLDDEGSGADAADRELLVALNLDRLDRQSVTRAVRGPSRRNAASSSTADSGPSAWTSTLPSSSLRTQPIDPEPARQPLGRVAIADALHLPPHDRPHRRRIRMRSLTHNRSRYLWTANPDPTAPIGYDLLYQVNLTAGERRQGVIVWFSNPDSLASYSPSPL